MYKFLVDMELEKTYITYTDDRKALILLGGDKKKYTQKHTRTVHWNV